MAEKLAKKACEKELCRLQAERVKTQNWTRASGARIVVTSEGRDTAGKGAGQRRSDNLRTRGYTANLCP